MAFVKQFPELARWIESPLIRAIRGRSGLAMLIVEKACACRRLMFDHVKFGVSNYATSKAFFHYYAAFVIAPDGHNIEVVCQEPHA